jgi:hypothetical protein
MIYTIINETDETEFQRQEKYLSQTTKEILDDT